MRCLFVIVLISIKCFSVIHTQGGNYDPFSFTRMRPRPTQGIYLSKIQETSTSISMEWRSDSRQLLDIVDIVYIPSKQISSTNKTYENVERNPMHLFNQTNEKYFKLESLQPNTEYMVCAKSGTLSSKCKNFATKKLEGKIRNLLIEDKNATHTTIGWSPPMGLAEMKGNYEITYIVTTPENQHCLIRDETKAHTFSFNNCDADDMNICVAYKQDAKTNPTCVNLKDSFLRNIRIERRERTNTAKLSWDWDPTDDPSMNSQKFSVEYDFSGICTCDKTSGFGDKIEVNATPNIIPYPKDPVLVLIRDKNSNLVGKFFDDKSPRLNLTNDTVNVKSEYDSLTFSWCIPNINRAPANISLSIFTSHLRKSVESKNYTNFVGCHWEHKKAKLTQDTSYEWTIEMKRKNESSVTFGGSKKTNQIRICGGFSNLAVHDNRVADRRTITFKAAIASKTGTISSIKLRITNLSSNKTKIHPFDLSRKGSRYGHGGFSRYHGFGGYLPFHYFVRAECYSSYCKVIPDETFTSEGNYSATITCRNMGSQQDSEELVHNYSIQALVPTKAHYGLDCKRKNPASPHPWNMINITINQDAINDRAGIIRRYYIIHGKRGALPNEYETGYKLDHPNCNISKNNEDYHTRVEHAERIHDFPLDNLEYNEAYEVMFFYYNSEGCASSNKLMIVTPSNLRSPIAFFMIMIPLYVAIMLLAAYYSKKSKPYRLIPPNISLDMHHPREKEFEFKISKENAKEVINKLLEGKSEDLLAQYKKLNEIEFDYPALEAYKGENQLKNRYNDIVPYDHSRVILINRPGAMNDYINASFVHGYHKPLTFIACQGPKKSTIIDFWRMIWENHVRIIVMVTNLIERKEKCSQYWPSKSDVSYPLGEMALKTLEEYAEPENDYTLRKFELTKQWTSRTVEHYHYTAWPDKGCPSDTIQLLKMIREIKHKCESHNQQFPIVVHCSAGVGRTGTFIALYNLMDELNDKSTGHIDIMATVFKLRMMRMTMVQTPRQYRFIYQGVLRIIEPHKFVRDPFENIDLLREGKFTLTCPSKNAEEDISLSDEDDDEGEGLEPIPDVDDENSQEKLSNTNLTDEAKSIVKDI